MNTNIKTIYKQALKYQAQLFCDEKDYYYDVLFYQKGRLQYWVRLDGYWDE